VRMLDTIGADRYLSMHLEAPDEVRRNRDSAGIVAESMSPVYEKPDGEGLRFDTSQTDLERSVNEVVRLLRSRGTLWPQLVRPVTVWRTGLSGSGKSTIAQALAETLEERGVAVRMIDGTEFRPEERIIEELRAHQSRPRPSGGHRRGKVAQMTTEHRMANSARRSAEGAQGNGRCGGKPVSPRGA
jgi:adenylylsulfate kinase-like enzyme